MEFHGFSADTFRFLAELAKNNNRPWFRANRERYERFVRTPALAFIEAMAPRLERISQYIYADPTPSGGSLMRVYRDTRFSGDKEPYKTNIGIQFRHQQGDDAHALAFYVHIEPGECFLGAGSWRPDSKALAAIRASIAEQPAEWRRTLAARGFLRAWGGQLWGDRLKRPPRGFDPDHPCVEDLKLKSFLGLIDLSREQVLSADLLDIATKAFAAASPLMSFICRALSLPY
jgi:uncharacterized protein (TIGR02453 family)